MRRIGPDSAPRFVLAAAFCALAIAPSCGRADFELLPTAVGGASGAANSEGSGALGGDGVGGTQPSDAGAWNANRAGGDGRPDAGASFGGSPGQFPCGADGGCPNMGLLCSPSAPFCTFCREDWNCSGNTHCDDSLSRCVECRSSAECGANEGCNLALRCATACTSPKDCANEPNHRECDLERGVCVSCVANSQCARYGLSDYKCYKGACVECYEDRQCQSRECNAGQCRKP